LATPPATNASDADLRQAVVSLGSSDYLEATEATRVLFAGGRDAIPFLVSGFSDNSKFVGLCGGKIRTSEVNLAPSEPVSGTSPIGEEQSWPSVQEVCLYLLISVLREDLYFAWDCAVATVNDGVDRHREISSATGEIAILFVGSEVGQTSISLNAVEEILHEHGVLFR